MRDALEVLRELVMAYKARQREADAGVLPGFTQKIREGMKERFDKALQDAYELLYREDLKRDLNEILGSGIRNMEKVTALLKGRGWPVESSGWQREHLAFIEEEIKGHKKPTRKMVTK